MEKNQLHHIGRRDFLKIVGISTASASLTACGGGDQSVAEDPVLGPVLVSDLVLVLDPVLVLVPVLVLLYHQSYSAFFYLYYFY